MKISFENFGVIKQGEIEQKPLTILCGENNTGKTYAMYAMYSVLNFELKEVLPDLEFLFKKAIEENGSYTFDLLDFIKKNIEDINYIINKDINDAGLESLFKNYSYDFSNSNNKVNLFDDNLEKAVFNAEIFILNNYISIKKEKGEYDTHIFINPHKKNLPIEGYSLYFLREILSNLFNQKTHSFQIILLPTERAGLNLFYQELNAYRTNLLHQRLQNNPTISNYSKPIADYIDWLNLLSSYKNYTSELFSTYSTTLQNNILGGNYSLDETNSISFHLNNGKGNLPLHLTSSTVKTYFGLWFYLQHMAQEGDVLMIDEPELSLHPKNQRNIARLFAQLVNKGIKIVISTHSDYIVKEISNLIMLSQQGKQRDTLMQRFNVQEDEVLKPEQVGAYLFKNNTITPMEISAKEGIIATTFDEVIRDLSEESQTIFYEYLDEDEDA